MRLSSRSPYLFEHPHSHFADVRIALAKVPAVTPEAMTIPVPSRFANHQHVTFDQFQIWLLMERNHMMTRQEPAALPRLFLRDSAHRTIRVLVDQAAQELRPILVPWQAERRFEAEQSAFRQHLHILNRREPAADNERYPMLLGTFRFHRLHGFRVQLARPLRVQIVDIVSAADRLSVCRD